VTLVLGIKDTGYGMSQEQLERLFDEYSRFNDETTRSIEGTGLGLAIMKHLVNLMGGHIHVESEKGKGTTVEIRLPQGMVDANVLGKKAADELRQFKQINVKHKETDKLIREPMPYGRVLVVDDVETNLFVAVRFMKPYKLRIETAVNGLDAIELVKSGNEFDVIFMDHMMPEMDGMEATKHLRDMGYKAPIVALTANAMSGQADVFLQNGFDDFISKPIDMRQLDDVLLRHIRDKQPPEVIEAALSEAALSETGLSEAASPADGGISIPQDGEPASNNRSNIRDMIDEDPLLFESFMKDARKAVTFLDELYKKDRWFEDEKELGRYTVTVHGMKSILLCIGEAELSNFAMDLESGARAGELYAIELGTPEFLRELRELLECLEQAAGEGGDEAYDDPVSLRGKMLEIEEMCADYDRKGALDAINSVRSNSEKMVELLDRIKEFVMHSEFEEAESLAAGYAAENKITTQLLAVEIEGLDINKGLERYDGAGDVYLKTLRSYAASTAAMLDEIIDVTLDRLKEYKIKVHGIKGASYDIRADKIGKKAEELENAATNDDFKFVEENNPAFLEYARSFIGSINELISAIDAENPKPKRDKPDEDVLLKLLIACTNYSMDDVDAAMAEIEKYNYETDGGLSDRLRKAVDMMQFPAIVEMLTEEVWADDMINFSTKD